MAQRIAAQRRSSACLGLNIVSTNHGPDAPPASDDDVIGASLVQLMTALVYEGPGVVAQIQAGLARRLAADGFEHVAEAVGIDAMA